MRRSVLSISIFLFSILINFNAKAIDFDGVAAAGQRMVSSKSWSSYAPEEDRKKFEAAYQKYVSALTDGKTPKFDALAEYEKSLADLETASKNYTWKRSLYGTVSDNLSKVRRARNDLAKQGIVDERTKVASADTSVKSDQAADQIRKVDQESVDSKSPRVFNMVRHTDSELADSKASIPEAKIAAQNLATSSSVSESSPQQPQAAEKTWRHRSDDENKKLRRDGIEKTTARCYYAGFEGFDKDGKCKPASDDPTNMIKQAGEFTDAEGKNLKCGKGLLACNPVIFGLSPKGKAICVPRASDATARCESSSKLDKKCTPEERANGDSKAKKKCIEINRAHAEYAKTMLKGENAKAELRRLERSINSSCGNDNAKLAAAPESEDGGLGIKAAQNRSSEASNKDFQKTCEQLKKQIAVVNEILYPNSAPTPMSPDDRQVASDGNDAGVK